MHDEKIPETITKPEKKPEKKPFEFINPDKVAKPSGFTDKDWNAKNRRQKAAILWAHQSNDFKREHPLGKILEEVR